MRFRTVIFLTIASLIAAIIASVAVGISVFINRSARADVEASLKRSQEVFTELQTYRQTLLRSQSRAVAEEPRLKAVVATQEVDHETVLGVAQELRQAIQTDLFVIVSSSGRLLADVADPSAHGDQLGKNPLVQKAMQSGEGSGVWTETDAAYQVQARRLSFGATIVGVLVVGFRLDDRGAESVYKNSGSAVVIALNKKIIAASSLEGRDAVERDLLAAALGDLLIEPAGEGEVNLYGETYLASAAPYPNYAGEGDLHYIMLRSLDRALQPGHRLATVLLGILLVAIVITLIFARVLSGRISRPLDALARFTKEITGNRLGAQIRVSGPREVVELGNAMNKMARELAESRTLMVKKERLEKEMEIASRIQASLLPQNLAVSGLAVAAQMWPATDVGGDYYDVIAVPDGCWIGIGDVTGHGLTSGLVMIMVQSVVASSTSLTRLDIDITPRDVVVGLNRVIFENVKHRLKQDEHVTFCLVRYFNDGRISFAGAHESIIIWRKASGKCDILPTPGTWIGGNPDIERFTTDTNQRMAPGDVMVLYSDGITGAMNAAQENFGMERLIETIEANCRGSVDALRDAIYERVQAWSEHQFDDMTVLVFRHEGRAA